MPIPLFLLKFKSENNRNPLISELSPKQKLHIIKCNMDCEDGIKRLEKIYKDGQDILDDCQETWDYLIETET